MNIWEPNLYLGDAQLLALASWLRNEEIRGEVKISLDMEMKEPLLIRLEHPSSHVLTTKHALLAEDP